MFGLVFNSQFTDDCIVPGIMVVKVREELALLESALGESDQEELDWGVSVLEELDQEVSGPVPLARAVVHWESYLEVLSLIKEISSLSSYCTCRANSTLYLLI